MQRSLALFTACLGCASSQMTWTSTNSDGTSNTGVISAIPTGAHTGTGPYTGYDITGDIAWYPFSAWNQDFSVNTAIACDVANWGYPAGSLAGKIIVSDLWFIWAPFNCGNAAAYETFYQSVAASGAIGLAYVDIYAEPLLSATLQRKRQPTNFIPTIPVFSIDTVTSPGIMMALFNPNTTSLVATVVDTDVSYPNYESFWGLADGAGFVFLSYFLWVSCFVLFLCTAFMLKSSRDPVVFGSLFLYTLVAATVAMTYGPCMAGTLTGCFVEDQADVVRSTTTYIVDSLAWPMCVQCGFIIYGRPVRPTLKNVMVIGSYVASMAVCAGLAVSMALVKSVGGSTAEMNVHTLNLHYANIAAVNCILVAASFKIIRASKSSSSSTLKQVFKTMVLYTTGMTFAGVMYIQMANIGFAELQGGSAFYLFFVYMLAPSLGTTIAIWTQFALLRTIVRNTSSSSSSD